MPIITLLVVIIIVGVLLWLANTYIPMAPPIKTIMNVLVVLVLVVWIISLLLPGLGTVRIGK